MSKLLTLFASALALVAPVAASAGPRPATAARNIVLVHGAWADGSGWRGVYEILKKDGYNVTMVANPDTSIADDAAATKRVLDRQDGATILVGHSYGGVVITEAGIHAKVTGLVYIAAFAPDVGESAFQFLPSDGPPPFTVSADGFAFLNKDAFLGGFAPDVPIADRMFMYDSQVPIAVACGTTPLTNAAWKTKPSWFLVASDDHIIPPAVQRTFATRMKATTVEQPGSHVSFVVNPQAAARMIEEAAEKAGK
jgi:pimeloyl-ACP methyl ester carboxylesterase